MGARLTDLSFKPGKPAFKKRRAVAEAIAADEPDMPMDKKFAIATATTKKVFKKKGTAK